MLKGSNVIALFKQMAGQDYDSAGMWSDMQQIITAVKPKNLLPAKLASFIAGITLEQNPTEPSRRAFPDAAVI